MSYFRPFFHMNRFQRQNWFCLFFYTLPPGNRGLVSNERFTKLYTKEGGQSSNNNGELYCGEIACMVWQGWADWYSSAGDDRENQI